VLITPDLGFGIMKP